MRMRAISSWTALLGTGLLLGGVALAGAAAADVFTWRTEDGGYAFTDDEKNIPSRYQGQARVKKLGGLDRYERFTPQDRSAIDRYEDRLAQRLERLRAFNATSSEARRRQGAQGEPQTITLRTGGDDEPGVDLQLEPGDEPVVVESVLVRSRGKAVAQNVQVTRQGDRVLAIVKPRSHEWNVSDVLDEEDLARESR
jgi:hypothetical protein